jgi:hypothetical protein
MKIAYSFLWRVVLVLSILFVGKAYFQNNETASLSQGVSSTEIESRTKIADEWFSAFTSLVNQSGEQEIRHINDVLKAQAVLAFPTEDGLGVVETKESAETVSIVPLLPSDAKYPLWKEQVLNNNFSGAFFEELNALVLKERAPVSGTFKGLLVAHEGNHVVRYSKRKAPFVTEQEFCFEEMAVHEFEERILSSMTNGKYSALLDEEAKRMNDRLIADEKSIQTSVPSPKDSYAEFDALFGKSLSEVEDNMRRTTFWVHSMFRAVDTYFDGDKEKQKALFLRATYYRLGLLPQENLK